MQHMFKEKLIYKAFNQLEYIHFYWQIKIESLFLCHFYTQSKLPRIDHSDGVIPKINLWKTDFLKNIIGYFVLCYRIISVFMDSYATGSKFIFHDYLEQMSFHEDTQDTIIASSTNNRRCKEIPTKQLDMSSFGGLAWAVCQRDGFDIMAT